MTSEYATLLRYTFRPCFTSWFRPSNGCKFKKNVIPIVVSVIERSQPKGVKPKIKGRKLRMGYAVM